MLEDPNQKTITLNYLQHLEVCKNSRVGMQEFPEKGELLKFTRPETLHHQPMIMYLDFETSNRSLSEVLIVFCLKLKYLFHVSAVSLLC